MTCVLRAIGRGFDVDAFLRDSPFSRATVFHRGAPRLPGVPDGKQWDASGFNLPVSEAGFNLSEQIEDAMRLLRDHADELRRLLRFPGLEEVCLDFGIQRREVAAQTAVFPADLLWQAGALDIDLVVTHYAVADEYGRTRES
jgi:hypothetical protein